jgi:hypothetical protein
LLVNGFGIPDAYLTAPIATGIEAERQKTMREYDRHP